MIKPEKKLVLIELNEVNFDIVKEYIKIYPGRFKSLEKLLSIKYIRTSSEKTYDQLEPWIQWASVHTCKNYSEHGIFRLGDIVGSDIPQIFERLEQAGYRVGAISPMNAENRLKRPAYFIPDPWIQTPSDSSWWSRSIGEAVSQAVNDNAQSHITAKSAFQIIFGFLRFARSAHFIKYFSLVLASRRKQWLKALILDLFLHDVHWTMFNNKRPHFSTLFLNAGAHIQHHYLFNSAPVRKNSSFTNPIWYIKSEEDPLSDALDLYDLIIGEFLYQSDVDFIVATGLSQRPYDSIKFYYRLNSHKDFLSKIGVKFTNVYPRMTRDFLIEFEDSQHAMEAEKLLASVIVEGPDNLPLFGEIDNRGNSLFVTLTFPLEITESTNFCILDNKYPLFPEISFVAIKNGMHQEDGFAFFTKDVASNAPPDGAHVALLGNTVLEYFKVV